jgi:hypothetical protein
MIESYEALIRELTDQLARIEQNRGLLRSLEKRFAAGDDANSREINRRPVDWPRPALATDDDPEGLVELLRDWGSNVADIHWPLQ